MKLKFVLAIAMAANAMSAWSAEALTAEDRKAIRESVEREIKPMQSMWGLIEDAQQTTRPEGPCSKVALAPEQKDALKAAIFEYRKEKITLKGQAKIARLTYAYIVTDSASVRADAEAAGAKITESASKLAGAKINFSTKVLYDIATAEQRGQAYLCMKFIEKAHRRVQSEE